MDASALQHTAYMICTSPRSGSTLLCRMLASTGVLGAPESLLYEDDSASWAQRLGLPHGATLPEILAAAMVRGRAGTSVFGLRQQYPSFPFLCRILAEAFRGAASDRARLQKAFGSLHFIHLSRADKLAQAVSLIRAEQTGLWHRTADGSDLEREDPGGPAGFDANEIRTRIALLESYDAAWLNWFDAEGITPLRITYDALSADPHLQVARVLSAVGQDPSLATDLTIPVQKLADATSARWIAAYGDTQP